MWRRHNGTGHITLLGRERFSFLTTAPLALGSRHRLIVNCWAAHLALQLRRSCFRGEDLNGTALGQEVLRQPFSDGAIKFTGRPRRAFEIVFRQKRVCANARPTFEPLPKPPFFANSSCVPI